LKQMMNLILPQTQRPSEVLQLGEQAPTVRVGHYKLTMLWYGQMIGIVSSLSHFLVKHR
jgi:hypothetical protein